MLHRNSSFSERSTCRPRVQSSSITTVSVWLVLSVQQPQAIAPALEARTTSFAAFNTAIVMHRQLLHAAEQE
eukprot:7708-Heterococcus_DN1.PRE.2